LIARSNGVPPLAADLAAAIAPSDVSSIDGVSVSSGSSADIFVPFRVPDMAPYKND